MYENELCFNHFLKLNKADGLLTQWTREELRVKQSKR